MSLLSQELSLIFSERFDKPVADPVIGWLLHPADIHPSTDWDVSTRQGGFGVNEAKKACPHGVKDLNLSKGLGGQ